MKHEKVKSFISNELLSGFNRLKNYLEIFAKNNSKHEIKKYAQIISINKSTLTYSYLIICPLRDPAKIKVGLHSRSTRRRYVAHAQEMDACREAEGRGTGEREAVVADVNKYTI